jgi:hypothetical protein
VTDIAARELIASFGRLREPLTQRLPESDRSLFLVRIDEVLASAPDKARDRQVAALAKDLTKWEAALDLLEWDVIVFAPLIEKIEKRLDGICADLGVSPLGPEEKERVLGILSAATSDAIDIDAPGSIVQPLENAIAAAADSLLIVLNLSIKIHVKDRRIQAISRKKANIHVDFGKLLGLAGGVGGPAIGAIQGAFPPLFVFSGIAVAVFLITEAKIEFDPLQALVFFALTEVSDAAKSANVSDILPKANEIRAGWAQEEMSRESVAAILESLEILLSVRRIQGTDRWQIIEKWKRKS